MQALQSSLTKQLLSWVLTHFDVTTAEPRPGPEVMGALAALQHALLILWHLSVSPHLGTASVSVRTLRQNSMIRARKYRTPITGFANENPWGHTDYNRDVRVNFGEGM